MVSAYPACFFKEETGYTVVSQISTGFPRVVKLWKKHLPWRLTALLVIYILVKKRI